jgi:RimJ/RimL family protein N-acetyltransferase
MSNMIETERLILRTWTDADIQPMYAINQDPRVMEYFPGLQDLATTKKFIEKVKKHDEQHGFSLYATVRKDHNEFIGFIGLYTVAFEAHFTPAAEIGWRLSSKHQGHGFATEGAQAVLDAAFNVHHLPEVVSFTVQENTKSTRVMEKIGLQHDPKDDFDHPNLADDSPLKRHVLYRITQAQYFAKEIS